MSKITSLFQAISSRYLTTDGVAKDGVPFTRYLLWGAGGRGELIKDYFEDLGAQAVCFVDNDARKHGTTFCGLPVYSLESALKKFPELPFFIASDHYKAIMQQLMEVGVTNSYAMPMASFYYYPLIMQKQGDAIEKVLGWLADDESRSTYASIVKAYLEGDDGCLKVSDYPQYFHPRVRPESGDVVIDGGAFNGDTCTQFSNNTDCAHIISFEPSEKTYELLCARSESLGSKVTCVRKGLWSCDDVLSFSTFDNTPAGNRVTDHGLVKVRVTSIDATVKELGLDRVDVIKLDVEGAELEALKGARNTIKQYKPKLQISIYHKLEDIWTLPQYIKSLDSSYEMYVGHHAMDPHESILYAC
jgi:FkbM family methyltransferase